MTGKTKAPARAAAKAKQKIRKADAAAAEAARPIEEGPASGALALVSKLADQPQLRTLSVAMVAGGAAAGARSRYGPRLVRAGARMLVAHELATAAKNFVKKRVDRTRPRSTQGADMPARGGNQAKEESSFPSGHAAGAAAVARAFAREFPEQRIAAAVVGSVLAAVQVPRCAHYPSDIGAGAAIGLAAEALVAALFPARPNGASVSA